MAQPSSLLINNTLTIDGKFRRVGVNCNTPVYDLDVLGAGHFTSLSTLGLRFHLLMDYLMVPQDVLLPFPPAMLVRLIHLLLLYLPLMVYLMVYQDVHQLFLLLTQLVLTHYI